MRTKKGQALIIAAIFIIMILMVLWTVMTIPYIKTEEVEKDIEVRSEIHTMGNALDAAKLYMETALAYSTYQACYDNLRNGGMDSSAKAYKGYPLWDAPAGKEGFDQALQRSILSNLELYRKSSYKFMSEYFVNIPTYEVTVLTEPGRTSVGAWNSSNFWIEKTQESGERIRLEKYGFLQGEYPMVCYGIYAKGLEAYSLAQAAVEKAWTETQAKAALTGATEAEINSQLSAYNQTFITKAKSGLYALSSTGTDYDTGVNVMDANLKWTSSVTVGPDKTEAKVTYTPEVYVKFEITNIKSGQEFTVYDGSKVIMSPMTLVFVGKFSGPRKDTATIRYDSSQKKLAFLADDGTVIEEVLCQTEENCQVMLSALKLESGIPVQTEGVMNVGSFEPIIPVPGTEILLVTALECASGDVPRELVLAMIHVESRWKPNDQSAKGALGLMQIKPSSAASMGWSASEGSLFDPCINVKYGSVYMKSMLDKFSNERIALAAYNSGETNVRGLLREQCPAYPSCSSCQICPSYQSIEKRLVGDTVAYVTLVKYLSGKYALYLPKAA